jgi:hypothetical protein
VTIFGNRIYFKEIVITLNLKVMITKKKVFSFNRTFLFFSDS